MIIFFSREGRPHGDYYLRRFFFFAEIIAKAIKRTSN